MFRKDRERQEEQQLPAVRRPEWRQDRTGRLTRLSCVLQYGQLRFGRRDLVPCRRLRPQQVPHEVIPAPAGDVHARLAAAVAVAGFGRSEEHTSELQSLMRISYAVFCLKKKKTDTQYEKTQTTVKITR